MVDEQEIRKLVDDICVIPDKWWIEPDGRVSSVGNVQVYPMKGMKTLPIRFHKTGPFSIIRWDSPQNPGTPSISELETLEGCPDEVDGWCNVHGRFRDLKGSPRMIQGDFVIASPNLISLDGSPDYIRGTWELSYRPDLPLLRTLVAEEVELNGKAYPERRDVEKILDNPKWRGRAKAGAILCAAALIKAGFGGNAKW